MACSTARRRTNGAGWNWCEVPVEIIAPHRWVPHFGQPRSDEFVDASRFPNPDSRLLRLTRANENRSVAVAPPCGRGASDTRQPYNSHSRRTIARPKAAHLDRLRPHRARRARTVARHLRFDARAGIFDRDSPVGTHGHDHVTARRVLERVADQVAQRHGITDDGATTSSGCSTHRLHLDRLVAQVRAILVDDLFGNAGHFGGFAIDRCRTLAARQQQQGVGQFGRLTRRRARCA